MKKLIFICGLCVIENKKETINIAKKLKEITDKYPVEFIFKASYDKANRTSDLSFRGIGLMQGIYVLSEIKEMGIKVLTDIHCSHQVKMAGCCADVIQIPAFLCRQTDLVKAIGATGKTVNIKKGQFLAPEDVKYIIQKIEHTGNNDIMITERGTCFGYHNLIVDYRSFLILKKMGYPVIFDATHAQQRPSAGDGISEGNREFTEPMIFGAIACGVDGIFIEIHPDPTKAKSDSATSLYLDNVESLLKKMVAIKNVIETLTESK